MAVAPAAAARRTASRFLKQPIQQLIALLTAASLASFDPNSITVVIVVIPSSLTKLYDLDVREWIQNAADKARLTTSVCTGALLLAKAGLLSGRRATTHWGAHDLLASLDSTIVVERHSRVVDDTIVTSAGIAAGIDMALAVVESLHGKAVADETARYMEFPRHPHRERQVQAGV